MARARVLIGGFSIEANTFALGATTLNDLRGQVFGVGAELHRDFMRPESELAGAWSALAAADLELVPSLATWAGPGRPLASGVLDEISRLLLAPLDGSIDGAYLMLHGACVAHDDDDPEGRVLAELRARLGPERPIVVSLDCHANPPDGWWTRLTRSVPTAPVRTSTPAGPASRRAAFWPARLPARRSP